MRTTSARGKNHGCHRQQRPTAANVRITFLVSDGLYFGEGPDPVLRADAMAGPVLAKAIQLLQAVVDPAVEPDSRN